MAYAVLAALFFCGWMSLYVLKVCFYSPKDRLEDPYERANGEQYEAVADIITDCVRVMDSTPCQWVSTKSFDGLTLWARFYFVSADAPTVIVFHGYRGNALRDGAASFGIFHRLGFNVLLPDQRAHARSGGRLITFGVKERFDVKSWAKFTGTSAPILLSGLSMGAATVLMASDLHLPENVVGILADCPYNSPAAIIRKVCRDRRFPEGLVYPFILWTARVFGGFDLESVSAEKAVQNTVLPILLLHGEDDRFVPCGMSRDIAANCAFAVELVTFPGAGHGLCYMTDPHRYEIMVNEFLHRIPALLPYLKTADAKRARRNFLFDNPSSE